MARIPDAFIDDLLARTDIVEVIGARVPLRRAGREYQARCPFHDERTPSFTVSPGKQFYHCFGCGAHGSAIGFLMAYDRMEFLDAVEELARRAGMEVPQETRQRHQHADLAPLFEVLERAADFFRERLGESPRARQYLQRRGLDPATVERFGLGYAPPGWDALRSALGTDARRLALLERAGLLSRNDAGRVYDRFRDRVMFPIHDRRGRVIAFGGRVLSGEEGPKYLNSPETPLFHKGRELYGLWQVRQAHSRIPRLIVVEGYMDVLALFRYGIDTAVATLGTATSADHAELLFRNAADVYFCFDGDRAGRSAAWKAAEAVLPRMRDGRQAFFLFLPEGEDPDSLLQKQGAEGFQRQLERSVPLSDFFFAELGQDVDLATLDGKARLAERCRPWLERIPEGAFRDLMELRLGELTGLDRARGQPPAPPAPRPHRRPTAAGARRSLVRTLVALLLQRPQLALEAGPPPWAFSRLRQPGVPLLGELLELCQRQRPPNTAALLEHLAGREETPALHKLALVEFPGDESAWQKEFRGGLLQLERQARTQRIAELQALQRERGLDAAEKDELRALLRGTHDQAGRA
ncbi:MAG: DNA primase [Lysobacteraceae bacterium]|nr:MAG: DNA primase [Xanthomonadaceae bacterium]